MIFYWIELATLALTSLLLVAGTFVKLSDKDRKPFVPNPTNTKFVRGYQIFTAVVSVAFVYMATVNLSDSYLALTLFIVQSATSLAFLARSLSKTETEDYSAGAMAIVGVYSTILTALYVVLGVVYL